MIEYIVDLTEYRGSAKSCQGVKEEIVRCEDCKYCIPDMRSDTPDCDWCDEHEHETNSNCFCAWGERLSTTN